MGIMRIPTTVNAVQGTALPRRTLSLELSFRNPSTLPICILDAAWRVEAVGGYTIAAGRLLRDAGPTIEGMQEGYGRLLVHMTTEALSLVEEKRAGADVLLRAFSSVLVAQITPSGDTTILSQPMYAQFDNRGQGVVEHLVHQSEWIKLLSAMAWSELELIELPSRNLRSLPIPSRAIDRFESARDCYRRGLWAEAMANCRRAIEALVKDTSGEDDMGRSLEAISKLVGPGPRASAVNDLLAAFTPMLHLARHEAQPPIDIRPSDARFALHITGAALIYIGDAH